MNTVIETANSIAVQRSSVDIYRPGAETKPALSKVRVSRAAASGADTASRLMPLPGASSSSIPNRAGPSLPVRCGGTVG
jgi:hypothetical protein